MVMDSQKEQVIFMRRCLELARLGKGKTGMNPMVGSVITHRGKIIGEGYHRGFGMEHAEVMAIKSVKDKNALKESTLYVNLEPCSHFGKTPPCSLLIVESRIPRVVIGVKDPNPLVEGRGIKALKGAGINVRLGILNEEAVHLNRRFFTNILKKRPYVILKWAESRDGFIDVIRNPGDPVQPTWITNLTARKLVHKWRGEEDGIMAGYNTILKDDPELSLRLWTGKQPVRITVDRKKDLQDGYRIKNGEQETIIFTESVDIQKEGIYQKLETGFGPNEILTFLVDHKVGSVIIEGGAKLINEFIDRDLWDEARVFRGLSNFKEGVKAPVLAGGPFEVLSYRNNELQIFFNQNNRIKAL